MIAVVDYGMGNLHSVRNSLEMVGADAAVTRDPDVLRAADRIVLPGVGAFGECLKNLTNCGLVEPLAEEVLQGGKPFLGICLGMQVLASEGHEYGTHPGLGWVPGVVQRFSVSEAGLKVPHAGWNEINPRAETPLFRGLRTGAAFYFVHSYHFVPTDPKVVIATADYGGPFAAAVQYRNILATQFHPEKSQQDGLTLLENFLEWEP